MDSCDWETSNMVLMDSRSVPLSSGKNTKRKFLNKTPFFRINTGNTLEFKFSAMSHDGVMGIFLTKGNDELYKRDMYYFYLRNGHETSYLLKCGPSISSTSYELPSNLGNRNCIIIGNMDLANSYWNEVEQYKFRVMVLSGRMSLLVESVGKETKSWEWSDESPLDVAYFSLGTIDITGEFTIVGGNVLAVSGEEGVLLSPPFVPSFNKVCMAVTYYIDEKSGIELELVLSPGDSIRFTCIQSTAMAGGWTTSLYVAEIPKDSSDNDTVMVQLTASSYNKNGVFVQRIAGCNSRGSEDIIVISHGYLEYVPFLIKGFDVAVDGTSNSNDDIVTTSEYYSTTQDYYGDYSTPSPIWEFLDTDYELDTSRSEHNSFPDASEEFNTSITGPEICKNSGVYLKEEGMCTCPAGFIGVTCEKGCGFNKFGSKCDGRCSKINSGCKGMILCRPKLGCNCAPGLKGIFCHSECDEGWYGVGCKEQCGSCFMGDVCDPYSGMCPQGCTDDYYPPFCREKYSYVEVSPEIYSIGFKTVTITANLKREKINGRGSPRFYQIQYRVEKEENWSYLEAQSMVYTPVEAVLRDLIPGTLYDVRVVIYDEDGGSYQGSDLPVLKVRTKCQAVTGINYDLQEMLAIKDSFSVFWNYTAKGPSTCHVVHFEIELNEDWGWRTYNMGLNTSATFTGMLPAQEYQVRVRAITTAGAAKYSDILQIRTKENEPEAVFDFKLVSTNYNELKVEWSPPLETAGKIQYYSLSYECQKLLACDSVDCSYSVGEMQVTGTSAVIQDLLSHAQYSLSVAAVSATQGPGTPLLAVTDMTDPEVPPGMSYKPAVTHRTNTSFTVHWSSPENCSSLNGYLYGYVYFVYSENNSVPVMKNSTQMTSVTFKNLTPYTQYTAMVFVETSAGWNSQYPLQIPARTRATVPGPVQDLTVYKRERRMLGLKWKLPEDMYGPLKSFTVTCTAKKFKTSSTVEPEICNAWPSMYCFTFGSLHPDTEHFIMVTARNTEVDEDGEPAMVQAVTKESSPEPPSSLRILSQTESSLTIEWGIPELLNGRLKSFLIAIQQTDSADSRNCCKDYDVHEMKVDMEQALYIYQAKDLRPSSTFSISVSAKTVLMGPGMSVTGYTKPSVPYMDGNIQILSNTNPVSTSPTVKLFPPADNLELIRGYLLLVMPQSPTDDFQGSSLWNESLQEEIVNNTKHSFYIALELEQADLQNNPEVFLGTGREEMGKWGEVRDPVLQAGEDYRLGLVVILEYHGVLSVGFTETTTFAISL